MRLKKRPNHRIYIQVLRRLSPEARLRKAFELGEFSRALFKSGLRSAFPYLSDEQFRELYLERLKKCHNRNY